MSGSVQVVHAYQSDKADPTDTTKIGATKWNADHVVEQSIAGFLGSTGGESTVVLTAAEAIDLLGASLILDDIGSTQGQILYRGAAAWGALAPGTSGRLLQTQGAGADPVWASSFNLPATTTPYDADALLTASSTVGGFFSDFDCKAAAKLTLVQAENQSATSGGGHRDALFLDHVDRDKTDYTLVGQKVSFGVRTVVTGYNDGLGGGYEGQYKDFVGGNFAAIANCAWSARGVSGLITNSVQYGAGVCTNEFYLENPASAASQSVGMQGILVSLSAKKGSADGSHIVRGVFVNNIGKLATHAYGAGSNGTDGDAGTFVRLLDGTGATVTGAAIIMPASASGDVGTVIEYDANDYSYYDRTGNAFYWVIGGTGRIGLSTGALFPVVSDGLALGSGTVSFSDLFLASGAVINFNNGDVTVTHSANALAFAGASSGYTFDALVTASVAGHAGRFVNTTDAASNQALRVESDRATPAAFDQVQASWYLSNSAGTQTEVLRLTSQATVVTASSESARAIISTISGGTFAGRIFIDSTGIYPVTNDTLALGVATLAFADLFMATGAVLNFNNNAASITHATDLFTVAGASWKLLVGTSTIAPLIFQSGTNLTAAAAGACEFDGVQFYNTIDTSSGRGAVPVEQYFHLTADGGTISTIANFFGATSNISLVASAYYIIDIYLWFLNSTAGTVTWTLTNSAAPTSQNIRFEMSPITGIVAPPGTATMLMGQYSKDATAARAFNTGTLTDAVDHHAHFRIFLQNGTGTNLKIQATKNVGGTITPRLNSYWIARRVSPNSIGTFAA